jgi:prepilin-type N-terminal cleavage/methylation domain-containing protein
MKNYFLQQRSQRNQAGNTKCCKGFGAVVSLGRLVGMGHAVGLRRDAFGLIEVLVAMAISSILMIASVHVSLQSVKVVQKNELKDQSSDILISSLEISRSPVDFDIDSLLGKAQEGYFRLDRDIQSNEINIVEANQAFQGELNSCDESSEYLVSLPNEDALPMCNQIIIEEYSQEGIKRTFRVKSVVVYEYLSDVFIDELISYRTELIN